MKSRNWSLRCLAIVASLFVATAVMAGGKRVRLTPATANAWMQGHSAVYFSDDIQQIRYSKETLYIVAILESSTTGAYGGLWEASKPLSAINSEEFAKLGIDAVSFYDLFPEQDIPQLVAAEKSLYGKEVPQFQTTTRANGGVSEDLRAALLAKGRNYLIWVNWSGFQLRQASMIKPWEQMTLGYRIFDLERNELIANVDVVYMERVMLGDASPKEFLEQNELQRFKADVTQLVRSRFTSKELGTIGLAGRATVPEHLRMPVARP